MAAVFRYAKAEKLYSGENPASGDALEPLLGKPNHEKRHFPSLPYERVGAFLTDLRRVKTPAAFALEFVILTASRSDEVRSAPWSEFDLEWTGQSFIDTQLPLCALRLSNSTGDTPPAEPCRRIGL